jgi:hypothetical protein
MRPPPTSTSSHQRDEVCRFWPQVGRRTAVTFQLASEQRKPTKMANATGKGGWEPGQSGNPSGRGGFQPGVSGNPGGRPKEVREVKALARERTPEAIDVLTKIMRDPRAPTAARVSACRELLDRAYGRPESAINAKIESDADELDFSLLAPEERAEVRAFMDRFNPILEKARVRNRSWS